MSTATQTPPAPTQDQDPYKLADSVLDSQVSDPVFFSQLEALGIVPQNEQEAMQFKKIAYYLNSLEQNEQVKSSGDRVSWLDAVSSRLAEAAGHSSQVTRPEIKEAAAQLLNTQILRDSALIVHDHLSSQTA